MAKEKGMKTIYWEIIKRREKNAIFVEHLMFVCTFFLLIFFTSLAYIEKKELLARAKVVAQLKNVPNFN
jgi:hypothetical protein